MKTEYLEDMNGDEDCFSKGKHNIPNQYYKDLETGAEMSFTYYLGCGWCVGNPKGSGVELLEYVRNAGKKIPFPDTPKKYQKQEEEYYEMLRKVVEKDMEDDE